MQSGKITFVFVRSFNEQLVLILKLILMPLTQAMNILTYEDIQRVEEKFLALYQAEGSLLTLPSQNDLLNLSRFQSQLFGQTSPRIRSLLQKKLLVEDKLISVSTTEENGVLKLFIYNLLAVIYGPSVNNFNTTISQQRNSDLLKNFKCNLYGIDIKFSQFQNLKLQGGRNQEGQILVVHFLKFIENLQKTEQDYKLTLKCIQWLLERNPVILQIFILSMRFILAKLQVEGVDDYRFLPNPEQAISNLIDYFDFSYKRSDGLILFYEQQYFLTFVQKEVIFGHYSLKDFDDSSLMVSIQKMPTRTVSLIKTQSLDAKRTENSSNIMKRMLTNSLSQNQLNFLFEQKQQTPYFHYKENRQYNFQRYKQDDNDSIKEEQLRKEFAKVISDSDFSSDKLSGSNQISTPPTPTWTKQSNFVPQKNTEKQFRSTIQLTNNVLFCRKEKNKEKNCFKELNLKRTKKIQNELKSVQHNSSKNLVKVVDRGFQPLSAQAYSTKNEGFGFACDENQGFFLGNDEFVRMEASEQYFKNPGQDFNFHQCICRPFRLKRNACISKVVQFCFEPQKSKKKQSHPNFMNSDQTLHTYDAGPIIKVTPPKQSKQVQLKSSQARQERIPTFLKMKKEKTQLSTSSKGTKKVVKISRYQSQQKKSFAQSFKRYSQIIAQPKCLNTRNSTSVQKHKYSKSHHINYLQQQAQNLKKFDVNHIQSRSGLGLPQQSMKASNFHYPPNYHQNMAQFGQFLKETEKSNVPFGFFAPVQIIAPTVHLHSTNRSENQVIFNVNKDNPKVGRESNPQPTCVPNPNLFNGLQRDLNSNRSEKLINSFQHKYL